jgi:transcription initiation factor TFIIIB Brf1 subunit/transcription initiation factor TFIIB
MSGIIESCSHENQLIDYRGGFVVCGECGVVIEQVFESYSHERDETFCELSGKETEFVKEMMERLNLPNSIFSHIAKRILEKKDGKNVSETIMAHCLYTTLADLGIPFTVNDVNSITGINHSKISKDKKCKNSSVVIIKTEDILERACSKLNLNFKQFTLIKESIRNTNNGFNPSTIISAHIYRFCRTNRLNITLKQISSITGISCMSIQRYMKKNELSSRTEISER